MSSPIDFCLDFSSPYSYIASEWIEGLAERHGRITGGPLLSEGMAGMRKTAKQLVDEAMAEVRTLSVDEARALHGRDDVQFVDVRDVRELEREGVIPGAFHCPRGMLEFWLDPESPYHKDVFASGKEFVFYCNGAWRSALAADTAQQMGLPRVLEMDGGFTAWKNAGFPVAQRETKKK